MKTCKICLVEKELSAFGKDKNAKDKLRHKCKACCKIERDSRKENVELQKKLQKNKGIRQNFDTYVVEKSKNLQIKKAEIVEDCIKVNVSDFFVVYLFQTHSLIETKKTEKRIKDKKIKEKVIKHARKNKETIKKMLSK